MRYAKLKMRYSDDVPVRMDKIKLLGSGTQPISMIKGFQKEQDVFNRYQDMEASEEYYIWFSG